MHTGRAMPDCRRVIRGEGKGAFWLAVLVVAIVACTERLVVRPEGEFSWEPQGQMIWPIDGATVSGYHDAARPSHAGIDLAARPGDPVAAALAGRVAFVGAMRGFGNVVALTHANELTTVYAHLGDVRVLLGGDVLRGQTIGTIDEDGYLHYEIREAQGPVDPSKYYATAPRPVLGGAVDVREKLAGEPPEIGALGGQPELVPTRTVAAARPTALPARTQPPAPTRTPTAEPTPTPAPTDTPTPVPTHTPTLAPTAIPTPTAVPTLAPTAAPTLAPTAIPTPTAVPTLAPTAAPTLAPTSIPTPTAVPTLAPRPTPTSPPTRTPTAAPHRREPTARPQAVQPPTLTQIPPTPVPTPEPEQRESVLGGIAFGAALVGTNLVYVPVKLGYAALGTVIGGITLVLAHDREVAAEVWWPALGGDFFVTAAHLRGEEPLHFMGSSSETPEPPARQ